MKCEPIVGVITMLPALRTTHTMWGSDCTTVGSTDCCVQYFIFFFQAEDGIRDLYVTGVQTCALPIYDRGRGRLPVPSGLLADRHRAAAGPRRDRHRIRDPPASARVGRPARHHRRVGQHRSEERRVGKECRSRWAPYQLKKKYSMYIIK